MSRGLTHDDVRAIRNATDVKFVHENGVGQIAVRCFRADTGFTQGQLELFPEEDGDRHRCRLVPVDGSAVVALGPVLPSAATVAVHHAMADTPAMRTILRLLRVGDELRLRWYANTGCEELMIVNLVRDRLELRVVRGEYGDDVLHFAVGSVIAGRYRQRMIHLSGLE